MAVSKPAFILFMHIVCLLCLFSGSPFVAGFVRGTNETDHLALLEFKAAITSDPFGALNSWNESAHFCQWAGVTCGRRHQRVTVLRIDQRKLSGSVSLHVGNLSFLKVLSLRNNSLSGEIPPELGRLRRLQGLSLLYNSISGEIRANISSCSNLTVLELTGNRLEGEIPGELGSLSKLKGLYIGNNNLTGGLPSTLGNLSSLELIYASYNKIGDFGVGHNHIEGSLPSNLGITLPNLEYFSVAGNLFTGSIPKSLSNATKLNYLQFPENGFTGKVPSLKNLQKLEVLLLQQNHLGTGQVDDLSFFDTLTNATRLSYVSVSVNSFGGLLPKSINNLSTELYFFTLYENNIYGSIPSGIGNLINLQTLGMSINHLSGKIPSDIGKLQGLGSLELDENQFHGEIPLSLANLTSLVYLHLFGNYLRGNIPAYIGKFRFLESLSLSHNHLSGIIPKEFGSLSSLWQLDLANNNLSGPIPQEIGLLQNLEFLDVSENMLVGNIPTSFGGCVKLRVLKMENNTVWGILPSTLASLKGLEDLDLSHNNFSGKIPDYLEGFKFLQKLNLSFNDFDGAVPERGVFKNATAVSVEGNKKLCGGIPELQLQSCNSEGSRNKRFTLTMKLITSISLGLLGLLLSSCFLYLCWFKKTVNLPSVKFLGNSFPQLSYQNLLKATDGFSSTNLIGVGSFGSVYKGILDEGQKVVAVKVLNLQFQGASKSFIAECKALKNIKHRNLVKILTACASIDYQGNDFKALVYEFMVNGTLEQWLHPSNHGYVGDDGHEESRRLNFLQRLNIAIDVASALDYLHHYSTEPIVHCDLKPSNVLLDDDMTAHVGDFGLARFLREATSRSSPNQPSSSIGIRGSIGYIAPEYGMGNEVSPHGDVYSYGILLLEMFTGKKPTNSMFTNSLTLHKFVEMALLGQVENISYPTLFSEREMGEASSSTQTTQNHISSSTHKIQECLVSILKIGVICSHDLPTDRMDIKDVVTRLHDIRSTMLQTVDLRGRTSTSVLG